MPESSISNNHKNEIEYVDETWSHFHDFFQWLDGPSKPEIAFCPRSVLDEDTVSYLTNNEDRMKYAIEIDKNGTFRPLLRRDETISTGPEGWIFVTEGHILYAYFKKTESRPRIHHSTFLAGAPVEAAGLFVAVDGRLSKLFPHSGHYRPAECHLRCLLQFLHDHHVDLREVEVDAQRVMKIARQTHKDGVKKKKVEGATMYNGLALLDFLSVKQRMLDNKTLKQIVAAAAVMRYRRMKKMARRRRHATRAQQAAQQASVVMSPLVSADNARYHASLYSATSATVPAGDTDADLLRARAERRMLRLTQGSGAVATDAPVGGSYGGSLVSDDGGGEACVGCTAAASGAGGSGRWGFGSIGSQGSLTSLCSTCSAASSYTGCSEGEERESTSERSLSMSLSGRDALAWLGEEAISAANNSSREEDVADPTESPKRRAGSGVGANTSLLEVSSRVPFRHSGSDNSVHSLGGTPQGSLPSTARGEDESSFCSPPDGPGLTLGPGGTRPLRAAEAQAQALQAMLLDGPAGSADAVAGVSPITPALESSDASDDQHRPEHPHHHRRHPHRHHDHAKPSPPPSRAMSGSAIDATFAVPPMPTASHPTSSSSSSFSSSSSYHHFALPDEKYLSCLGALNYDDTDLQAAMSVSILLNPTVSGKQSERAAAQAHTHVLAMGTRTDRNRAARDSVICAPSAHAGWGTSYSAEGADGDGDGCPQTDSVDPEDALNDSALFLYDQDLQAVKQDVDRYEKVKQLLQECQAQAQAQVPSQLWSSGRASGDVGVDSLAPLPALPMSWDNSDIGADADADADARLALQLAQQLSTFLQQRPSDEDESTGVDRKFKMLLSPESPHPERA